MDFFSKTNENGNERDVGIGLSLAFLALIAIGVSVGYFGVGSMRTLLVDTHAITENEWGDLRIAEEAFDASNQNANLNLLILEVTNRTELDSLLIRRAENSSRITFLLNRLKSRVNSEKEQELLDAVITTRAAYAESYEQTTNFLLKEQNRKLAREMWTKATFPLFLKYHLAWGEFVRFQTEEMDRRLAKSTAKYAALLDVTICFWVAGILLATGIAVFVVRTTTAETLRRRKAEADILVVNERKRVAEEVAASRQILQSILDAIPQRVFWKDRNCVFLGCNRPFATDAGLDSPAEIAGKSDLELSWAELAEFYRADDNLVMEQRTAKRNFHERLTRHDGSELWLETNKIPLFDTQGNVTGVLGTYEDIKERKRAERELRLTKASLEIASDAVLWIDRKAHIVYANQAACDSLERSREELVSLSIPDIDPLYAVEAWDAHWEEKRNRRSTTFQSQHKSKNGRVFPVEVTTNYMEFDGQEYSFAFVRDITERKRTEKELRLTQFSMEHASDDILWIDQHARIVYANQAACRSMGRSREELLSLSIQDIDPHFSKEIWKSFWNDLKTRGAMTFETQTKRKQDRIFPVEVSANYIEFDGQEYCFTFARDITERKRAEKELRLTKFSLENATDAIQWIDPQARLIYANEAACRSLGHSREELLSLSIPDIDPLFSKEVWDKVWQELKTRGSLTFETQHRSKHGCVFPVEVTATYLEFDGQEYSLAFVRDISERRALENQLRQAQKLEAIGQLAAGIAHEINTPTQFVTDNLTFLRDSWKATHELLERYRAAVRNAVGVLPPDVAAALDEAERNCDLDFIAAEAPRAIDQSLEGERRVAEIVRAMKEFSHPDAAHKTAIDLNKAIGSTLTVARNEWKYVAEVATELDANLPPVVCYPGEINQVILNLLVNAAHAIKEKVRDGEKGRITMGTRARGEFAEISVADTGTGIPEAIRTRIFEPFFTTKEVGKGTGQGLALAHSIVVKKHQGKIYFETEMGYGTTFFIHLPINPDEPAKGD